MYKILSLAFIIFIQIYAYKLRKKTNANWDQLWENIGTRFRTTLFELEGLLIKIGQLLSIRRDILPSPFINQIQDLTDQVPPSEWEEIKKILEDEWGGPLHEFVEEIHPKAIASASIGEVYKGFLVDGKEVAIKVQRPNIQSIIQTDFKTLKIIIWFANHLVPLPKNFINLNVLFQELKQVIEGELDFCEEKHTLVYFKDRLKGIKGVKVPEVYNELCTSKVLVMEWVDGVKLTDEEGLRRLSISSVEIVEKLIETFLPQWLEPGKFHADPHSGNVLVSKNGDIVLLDFGMVGEISKRDATYFQLLIEGLLSKNYQKAVESLINLGFLLPEADPKTMEKLLAELMVFQPEQLKEKDLMALKLEMNDIIQALPIQVPTKFVFLGRSFITMEGMIRNLANDDDELLHLIKPVFIKWLSKQGSNKWQFLWYWLQSKPLFKVLHSATDFLNLPQKLEEMKEKEQRRQFQFTIYENNKNHFVQFTFLGLLGIGAAVYLNHSSLLQLSLGVTLFSAIGYLAYHLKLKKWLKYMHETRRK